MKQKEEFLRELKELRLACETEDEFLDLLADNLFKEEGASPHISSFIGGPRWTPFEGVKDFLKSMKSGEWSWCYNSHCKYVNFWMDTRDGACIISNRHQKVISLEDLNYQYKPGSKEK